MTETTEEPEFSYSLKDIKALKRDLLATVFSQTHLQLLIYQRGKSLKTNQSIKSRKLSQLAFVTATQEPMPSADILNDIKLDRELDALRNIYKVAYEDLSQADFTNLKIALESFKQNNNQVEILTKEIKENKTILKQLRELQNSEQEKMSEQIKQKLERLAELREELSNQKRISHLEIRLVEKWEKNRQSQAFLAGQCVERRLMQGILELHRRLAEEQRIGHEIDTFRSNEISELKNEISHWKHKFEKEKSEIITKNLILSQNIADVLKSYEKHRDIMQQRQKFVAEYLQQKAEEQRLYEQQLYRIECAVRIQAWWRGVMVRRGLGQYRKKSKKGKKSKGKKQT